MADDSVYPGSSFNEVMGVLENRNFSPKSPREVSDFDGYRNGQMPRYPISFSSLDLGALTRDSIRTLHSRADYFDRIEKLVHSSGICVAGNWAIDQDSPYSGYFSKGSRALFIGRISTALEDPTNAGERGFGFAGKIFPTLNGGARVKTTSFFTIDVLSGTPAQRFLDVGLTNNPPLHPRFDLLGVLAKIIPAFAKADSQPTFRPVTQIARTGLKGELKSPVFMRLRPTEKMIRNNQADYRRELIQALSDNHQQLQFQIEVSDTTNDRNASSGWQRLGTIMLDRAVVSYGCDRRLHFSHPKDDKTNGN